MQKQAAIKIEAAEEREMERGEANGVSGYEGKEFSERQCEGLFGWQSGNGVVFYPQTMWVIAGEMVYPTMYL